MEVFSLKPDSKVVKRRLAIFGLHSDFIQLEDHCFRASNSVGKGDVLFESLTESAFGVEILTLCLFTPSNRFNASSDAPSKMFCCCCLLLVGLQGYNKFVRVKGNKAGSFFQRKIAVVVISLFLSVGFVPVCALLLLDKGRKSLFQLDHCIVHFFLTMCQHCPYCSMCMQ
ncbi:hypothetical protein M513_11780, partial [Trichuris suis]